MATAASPNPPIKDENKPSNVSVQSYPGTRKPKPTPMIFTDFASI